MPANEWTITPFHPSALRLTPRPQGHRRSDYDPLTSKSSTLHEELHEIGMATTRDPLWIIRLFLDKLVGEKEKDHNILNILVIFCDN